jgi:hypothetical protein
MRDGGATHRAGAVAGIFGPRNPVLAARAVLERGRQVLLIGEGTLAFVGKLALLFPSPAIFTPKSAGASCGMRSNALVRRRAAAILSAPSPVIVAAIWRPPPRPAEGPASPRAGRRQRHCRRRHLCGQRDLRGLGDRPRRILHSLVGSVRDRRPAAPYRSSTRPRGAGSHR